MRYSHQGRTYYGGEFQMQQDIQTCIRSIHQFLRPNKMNLLLANNQFLGLAMCISSSLPSTAKTILMPFRWNFEGLVDLISFFPYSMMNTYQISLRSRRKIEQLGMMRCTHLFIKVTIHVIEAFALSTICFQTLDPQPMP